MPLPCLNTAARQRPGLSGSRWMSSGLVSASSGQLVSFGFFDSCGGNLRYSPLCPRGTLGDVLIGDGDNWRCLGWHAPAARANAMAFHFNRPAMAPVVEGARGWPACEAVCVAGGIDYGPDGAPGGAGTMSDEVYCTSRTVGPSAPPNSTLGATWFYAGSLPSPVAGATVVMRGGDIVLLGGDRPESRHFYGVSALFDQIVSYEGRNPGTLAGACNITGWLQDDVSEWPARRHALGAFVPSAASEAVEIDPLLRLPPSEGTLLMGGGVSLLAQDSEAAMTDLWAFPAADNYTARVRLAPPLPLPNAVTQGSQHSMWRLGPDILKPLSALAESPSPTASSRAQPVRMLRTRKEGPLHRKPSVEGLPHVKRALHDVSGAEDLLRPSLITDDIFVAADAAWYSAPSQALFSASPLALLLPNQWTRRWHAMYPWTNLGEVRAAPADMLVTHVRQDATGDFPHLVAMASSSRRLWRMSTVPCQVECPNAGNDFLGRLVPLPPGYTATATGTPSPLPTGGPAPGNLTSSLPDYYFFAGSYTRGCVRTPLDAVCLPCTPCVSGAEYIANPATDACGASLRHALGYADSLCTPCTPCPPGTRLVAPCAGARNNVCEAIPSASPLPALAAVGQSGSPMAPLTSVAQLNVGAALVSWTLLIGVLTIALAAHSWITAQAAVKTALSGGQKVAASASTSGSVEATVESTVVAEAGSSIAQVAGSNQPIASGAEAGSHMEPQADNNAANASAANAATKSGNGCFRGGLRLLGLWFLATFSMFYEASQVLSPLWSAVLQLLIFFPMGALLSTSNAQYSRSYGVGILTVLCAAPVVSLALLARIRCSLRGRPVYASWRKITSSELRAFQPQSALWFLAALSLWRPALLLVTRSLGMTLGQRLELPSPSALPWRKLVRRAAVVHALLVDASLLGLTIAAMFTSQVPVRQWWLLPVVGFILQIFFVVHGAIHVSRLRLGSSRSGVETQLASGSIGAGGDALLRARRMRFEALLGRLLSSAPSQSNVVRSSPAGATSVIPPRRAATALRAPSTRQIAAAHSDRDLSVASDPGGFQWANPLLLQQPGAPRRTSHGSGARERSSSPAAGESRRRERAATLPTAPRVAPQQPRSGRQRQGSPTDTAATAARATELANNDLEASQPYIHPAGHPHGFDPRYPGASMGQSFMPFDPSVGFFHPWMFGGYGDGFGYAIGSDGSEVSGSARQLVAPQLVIRNPSFSAAGDAPADGAGAAFVGVGAPDNARQAMFGAHAGMHPMMMAGGQAPFSHAQHAAYLHAMMGYGMGPAGFPPAAGFPVPELGSGAASPREFTPLQVSAMAQQLVLRARASGSPQALRLARHEAFLRGSPGLLAAALGVVDAPQLPPQWRQVLELLDAIDSSDEGSVASPAPGAASGRRGSMQQRASDNDADSDGDGDDDPEAASVSDVTERPRASHAHAYPPRRGARASSVVTADGPQA